MPPNPDIPDDDRRVRRWRRPPALNPTQTRRALDISEAFAAVAEISAADPTVAGCFVLLPCGGGFWLSADDARAFAAKLPPAGGAPC